VNSVINNKGVIQAKSLVSRNGEVVLTGAGANIVHSGTIDVSGEKDAGSIMLGGDYQGLGDLATADAVAVMSGAVLKADGGQGVDGVGNGGKVIVWSDVFSYFGGLISAQGGANGGHGGLVETSSLGHLNVRNGMVNTLAAAGNTGTWLLEDRKSVV